MQINLTTAIAAALVIALIVIVFAVLLGLLSFLGYREYKRYRVQEAARQSARFVATVYGLGALGFFAYSVWERITENESKVQDTVGEAKDALKESATALNAGNRKLDTIGTAIKQSYQTLSLLNATVAGLIVEINDSKVGKDESSK